MNQRAPRRFLILLFIGLVVSFAVSRWMEEKHLKWLQDHPISVNLISGVVGFCGGFLMLAIVYNWFVDRDRVAQIRRQLLGIWRSNDLARRTAKATDLKMTVGDVWDWLEHVEGFAETYIGYRYAYWQAATARVRNDFKGSKSSELVGEDIWRTFADFEALMQLHIGDSANTLAQRERDTGKRWKPIIAEDNRRTRG